MDPEAMLKGRMAETLVEELLKKSGNKVYRFGYEAILQNLSQIQKSFENHSEAGERIRAIPDFIVIDEHDTPIFLEVKFRGNGELHNHDNERLERIKTFWKAKIIFVNCKRRPFFEVSTPPYFQNGLFEKTPLEKEAAWKIDADAYRAAEVLVEKYLSKPLIKSS
jgi:hypothetical protein